MRWNSRRLPLDRIERLKEVARLNKFVDEEHRAKKVDPE
jgi:hypothetical protein